MCILDHTLSTLFCLGKFLKKLADDQCRSITKGSIYYIKHMYIQPFSMKTDWPINLMLNGTTVLYFAHNVFLLCEAELMGGYLSDFSKWIPAWCFVTKFQTKYQHPQCLAFVTSFRHPHHKNQDTWFFSEKYKNNLILDKKLLQKSIVIFGYNVRENWQFCSSTYKFLNTISFIVWRNYGVATTDFKVVSTYIFTSSS